MSSGSGVVSLTVVIPTLNEVDRLPACLASVQWAAEVIVADAGSTDGTQELARRLGAKVIEVTGTTIAQQRNVAIAAASHPWVFALDADERVSAELATSIARELYAPRADVFRVHMRNRYLGALMERGGWGRDRHLRLFRSTMRYQVKRVHEGLEYAGVVVDLAGRLDHDSYRNLSHQLAKVHQYAQWGAEDLFARGKRAGVAELVARPIWRFIRCYLLQGACLEGHRGFVLAAVHAWSAFAKYALLWDMQRQATESVPSESTQGAVVQPIDAVHPKPIRDTLTRSA